MTGGFFYYYYICMATGGILSTEQILKHNIEQLKKNKLRHLFKKTHRQHVTHTNARVPLISSSNAGGKAKSL